MASKFKCKDCRHSFVSDSDSEALCPKCNSDNIEPVSGTMLIIGKIILFVTMALVGYFAIDILVLNNVVTDGLVKGKNDIEPTVVADKDNVVDKEDIYASESEQHESGLVQESMMPIDANFSVFEKNLTKSGFTFSVIVAVDYDSEVEYYAIYLNEDDTDPVMTSLDGKFSSNKYYNEDGRFFVKAYYKNGNSTLMKPIDGFVMVKSDTKPLDKITKEELQSMIDKSFKDRTDRTWYAHPERGGDKRLAERVSIKNDTNGKSYSSISAMFVDCWMCAKKINVESVSYDENKGTLNSIIITIEKR